MRNIFLILILVLFIPVWLALFFVFGENSAAYFLNSKEKNVLSVKNINLPKLYLVQSGSMEPAVGVGSVVLVKSADTYVNGDIVSFDIKGTGKNIITHRIAYKDYPNGIDNEPMYMTKGDANEDFDTTKITDKNIIGKVIFTIPYLGYLASWAKKPWGFILLVIVPATILIYEELKTIYGEVKKGIGKFPRKLSKHKKNGEDNISDIVKTEPHSDSTLKRSRLQKLFKPSAYFIPIVGAGLVFISLSASFFSDKEATADNLFQAASDFGGTTPTPAVTLTPTPPPIARTLVINEFLWNSSCSPNPQTKFWIELYNGYETEQNLKDWRFRDGNNQIIQISNSNFYIQPQEYILITKSNSTFSQQCYVNEGNVTVLNLGGNPSFLPGDTGGIIRLEGPNSVGGYDVIDRVDYGTNINPDIDQSIARNPNAIDTASGDSFSLSDFTVQEDTNPGFATP